MDSFRGYNTHAYAVSNLVPEIKPAWIRYFPIAHSYEINVRHLPSSETRKVLTTRFHQPPTVRPGLFTKSHSTEM